MAFGLLSQHRRADFYCSFPRFKWTLPLLHTNPSLIKQFLLRFGGHRTTSSPGNAAKNPPGANSLRIDYKTKSQSWQPVRTNSAFIPLLTSLINTLIHEIMVFIDGHIGGARTEAVSSKQYIFHWGESISLGQSLFNQDQETIRIIQLWDLSELKQSR